jgi:hypothetical protein
MKKGNNIHCSQAQPCYFDYLTGQNNPASELEFEHIRQCPQCQGQIKRLEQEIDAKSDSLDGPQDMLAMHHRCLSQWIDCDVVKPFLASQAHPQLCLSTQTPITVHIARCQACRNDLQTLISLGLSGRQLVETARVLSNEPGSLNELEEHKTAAIGIIRNRKASGIITRLQTDDHGQTRVQVRHAPGVQLNRRHFLVRFTAAAGILLVASLVIMMTTTAGGISIQDVYGAIHSIENCKIEIRDTDFDSPGQTILVSRKLNLAVSQRKNEMVILDFRNKRILKSTPETGVTIEPSESKLLSTINRPDFGLLPFDSIARMPSNYQWKRQDNLPQNRAYEIYELTWVESAASVGPIERMWRGYLLGSSHLPVRIEWLEKRANEPWKTVTEAIIQYPDTQTVLKELQTNSLYHLLEGDQVK